MVRRSDVFFSRRVCLSVGRRSRRASRVGVFGTRGDRVPFAGRFLAKRARIAIFSNCGLKNHRGLPGHGCWFCGIHARDGGSKWPGGEPRDAGTEARVSFPRSIEAGEPTGGHADGTYAYVRARVRTGCDPVGGTISNEHRWQRVRGGSHLHDGSDDDALADEGGGGECGDHVLRTDGFERGWGSMLVRL